MKKRNILFLFADQHRGDWLPFDRETFKEMGNQELPIKMDNLKCLMDNGATFTNAFTDSPLCVPARACLAAGVSYDRSKVFNNNFCYPLDVKSFYRILMENDYNVGGVGKFDLHKPILYWGKDGEIPQDKLLGFTHACDSEGKYDLLWSSFYEPKGPYSNFLHSQGLMKEHAKDYVIRYYNSNDARATSLPEYAYSDNWVTENAMNMIDKINSKDKSWFLQVNFTGPHNPWDITLKMKEKWGNVKFPLPHGFSENENLINEVRQNYAAMLENIDKNIGKIIEKLKEIGEFENTLIVYSADHGEMLGDNNRFLKSVPTRGAVHIPLIIYNSEIKRKIKNNEYVQLHDLAHTFIDYAGLKLPEERNGISLLPALNNDNWKGRDYLYYALHHTPNCSEHVGYEDLIENVKKKPDHAYIEEFNKEFNVEKVGSSIKKLDYHKDWNCIQTKDYKLIQFGDQPSELYDLRADLWESKNIAKEKVDILKDLENKYHEYLKF